MADSPYISWYTSDFLTGVADMTAEEIGVYAVILNLIADRGAPIEDDSAWLARRCGTTTRGANRILTKLASEGKIERRNGLIGNKRMLDEVGKRDKKGRQARDAASEKWRRWRASNKPQLDLEPESSDASEPEQGEKLAEKTQKNSRKNGQTPAVTFEKNSPVKSEEPENSADPAMRTHPDSRAGVLPELESIQSNESESNLVRDGEKISEIDRSDDLLKLLERVAAAAGYAPTTTSHYSQSIDLIKAWRDLGADFDATVIPTIETIMRSTDDRTSSLKRFDAQIRLAVAKHSAIAKRGAPPAPPQPILQFEGEPPPITAFREDLLKALGPIRYTRHAHKCRFEIPNRVDGKPTIRVVDQIPTIRLMDDDRGPLVKAIAKQHGFVEVW